MWIAVHPFGQRAKRIEVAIPINAGQDENVGIRVPHDLEDREDIRIFGPFDVSEEKAWPIAGKFGVQETNSKGVGSTGRRQPDQTGKKSASVASPDLRRSLSIIRAIRPIAIPRMKREAGRKAHAATVQISV